MAKDKTEKPSSLKKNRASPYYPGTSKTSENQTSKETQSNPVECEKEWEEARCPVCMDHPHNAVLLSCSSHGKGCRPYMCDTSYRHSNCLDQFNKSSPDASATSSRPTKLICPLCRGEINGWEVIEPARKFMNLRSRICASASCDFSGNYSQLRKHARLEHPSVRPSHVEPHLQMDWTRLEREMEFEDVFGAYEMPLGEFLMTDDDILFELVDLENYLGAMSEPEEEEEEDRADTEPPAGFFYFL